LRQNTKITLAYLIGCSIYKYIKLKSASLNDLKLFRKDANHIEYVSLEAMKTIIVEYISAYHAFYSFMEWTIIHDIDFVPEYQNDKFFSKLNCLFVDNVDKQYFSG
jgi:hypothetical protein